MLPSRAPSCDAVARSRDVIEALSSPPCPNYLIDELVQLLASSHMQVSQNSIHIFLLYMFIYIYIYQSNIYKYSGNINLLVVLVEKSGFE